MDWLAVSSYLQALAPLILAGVIGVYRELRKLNGRLLILEERLHGHVEADEKWQKEMVVSLREIRDHAERRSSR